MNRPKPLGGGHEPRWTHGAKDGVGTAYAASSRIWFTFWNGIVTEVYYPTVDRPQLRDLQYSSPTARASSTTKNVISSPNGTFADSAWLPLHQFGSSRALFHYQEIIADRTGCVLQHTKLAGDESFVSGLRFTPFARSSRVGGWGNSVMCG